MNAEARLSSLAPLGMTSALLLAACGGTPTPAPVRPSAPPSVRPITIVSALAADSMQGRRTATPGALRAARYLAAQMQAYGLEPAGDSAYFQRVPFVVSMGPEG